MYDAHFTVSLFRIAKFENKCPIFISKTAVWYRRRKMVIKLLNVRLHPRPFGPNAFVTLSQQQPNGENAHRGFLGGADAPA